LDEKLFGRVLQSTRSVAFFVGYVTVPDLYAAIRGLSFDQSVAELEQKLGDFEWNNFYLAMDSLKKSALFKNIDPKSWPLFRNLLLRFVPGITEFMDASELIENDVFTKEMEASGKYYANERGHNWIEIKSAWKSGREHELIDADFYAETVEMNKEKVSEWFESGSLAIDREALDIK
jgi:hypothetical protein